MGEIDCMDLAWAPATGLVEWFAAAGIDARAPHEPEVAADPHLPAAAVASDG